MPFAISASNFRYRGGNEGACAKGVSEAGWWFRGGLRPPSGSTSQSESVAVSLPLSASRSSLNSRFRSSSVVEAEDEVSSLCSMAEAENEVDEEVIEVVE